MAFTTLADLSPISDDEFTDTFVRNQAIIFQNDQTDIVSKLDEREITTLKMLRNRLCEDTKAAFPDLSHRTPINRMVKHLVIQDIFHLGYSLVNALASKELDKVFAKTGATAAADTTLDDAQGVSATELASLIASVTELKAKVHKLEGDNADLLRRINTLPGCNCRCSGDGENRQDTMLLFSDTSASEEASSESDESSSKEQDLETEALRILQDLEKTDRKKERKERRQRRKSQSNNVVIEVNRGGNGAQDHRPLSAAVGSDNASVHPLQAATGSPTNEVYLGSVDLRNSTSDVAHHLNSNGVQLSHTDIRELGKNHKSKSFCLRVKGEDYQRVINTKSGSVWPAGVKVRPFLPREQHKTQKNKQRQGSGARPRNRAPRQHQNHGRRETNQKDGRPFRPRRGTYQGERDQGTVDNWWYSWDYRDSSDHSRYDDEWPSLPSRECSWNWDNYEQYSY